MEMTVRAKRTGQIQAARTQAVLAFIEGRFSDPTIGFMEWIYRSVFIAEAGRTRSAEPVELFRSEWPCPLCHSSVSPVLQSGFWRLGLLHDTRFRECSPDLLHPVDKLDRRARRQDEPASRIAATSDWDVGFDLINPAHRKFDAQRLAVKEHAADGIGEGFRKLRTIDIAE
jgi:hypothetical protein